MYPVDYLNFKKKHPTGNFKSRSACSKNMVLELVVVVDNMTRIEYKRILRLWKIHKDTIEDIVKKRESKTIIFLKDTPKGWWLAVRLMRECSGKLYILKEVGYMDIPSKLMELSFERRWRLEYESIVERELKNWGLKDDGAEG